MQDKLWNYTYTAFVVLLLVQMLRSLILGEPP